MKKNLLPVLRLIIIMFVISSCNDEESALKILQRTINTIDTVETIYYKQDMVRSNPQDIYDTIFRFREMYFKRLITDSIVGVKGHWYMYRDDKENIIYEDIYDGNKLIRKNNRDSVVRIYDLVKYPGFRTKHFWSHNTLYGMQYEFKQVSKNLDSYSIDRLNDTTINGRKCYTIVIGLDNKVTMPGFALKLVENKGSISKTIYYIQKDNYYPIKIIGENYSFDNPNEKVFLEQRYYDIEFNLKLNKNKLFNTSDESISEFERIEIIPQ